MLEEHPHKCMKQKVKYAQNEWKVEPRLADKDDSLSNFRGGAFPVMRESEW